MLVILGDKLFESWMILEFKGLKDSLNFGFLSKSILDFTLARFRNQDSFALQGICYIKDFALVSLTLKFAWKSASG